MAQSIGVELYDIETRRESDAIIYCVMIQKEGGINLDECAHLSRLLSPLLDTKPPMGGKYTLEVSSPGIERKLKTKEHFERSIGEKVSITLNTGEKVRGTVQSFVDGNAVVDGVTVPFKNITRARIYCEW